MNPQQITCPHCRRPLAVTVSIVAWSPAQRAVEVPPELADPENGREALAAATDHTARPRPVCPDHGSSAQSSKHPGWFCPVQLDSGAWCRWRSSAAAATPA